MADFSDVLNLPEKEPANTSIIIPAEGFDEDFEQVRKNLYTIHSKGMTLLEEAIADALVKPSFLQAATGLMSEMRMLNLAIMSLHKKNEPSETVDKPINVDKGVFFGSTADLQRAIRDKKDTNS